LTVIQPSYFPEISTLARINAADVVVWANTFIYKKHSVINRARIKTSAGAHWLTVPVISTGFHPATIANTAIDWAHFSRFSHLKALHVSYQNSPYYFFLQDELENILKKEFSFLQDYCALSTQFLCHKMGIKFNSINAQLLQNVDDRTCRVVKWLEETDCMEYLAEEKEAELIHIDEIEKRGFSVVLYRFNSPEYHQLYGKFIPNLSGLDLLFNEGEQSRSLLCKSVLHQRGNIHG